MTPTAVTPAAATKRSAAQRSAAKGPAAQRSAATASPRPAGRATTSRQSSPHPSTPRTAHRAPAKRSTVPRPRAPRRVSGPARPAAGATTAPTRTAPARTAPARTAPARTAPTRSAPARPPRAARRTARATELPWSARAVATLRSLPDHSLLDRIVRGRLWIPLLGVLLAGIVAMQVEVLKLNASIGQSVVHAGQLQSANQLLRANVSRLADDQLTEVQAERMGMSAPPATQPLYVGGSVSANLSRAMANIHPPNPTAFAAQTSALAQRRANAVISSSGK